MYISEKLWFIQTKNKTKQKTLHMHTNPSPKQTKKIAFTFDCNREIKIHKYILFAAFSALWVHFCSGRQNYSTRGYKTWLGFTQNLDLHHNLSPATEESSDTTVQVLFSSWIQISQWKDLSLFFVQICPSTTKLTGH